MWSPELAAADPESATSRASEPLELVLTADVRAPRAAREAVGNWLTGQVGVLVRDDVLLVISELVTNSVQHAGTAPSDVIRVHVRAWNGRLHVAVEDAGRKGDVARRPAGPGLAGGLGLNIVDQLTLRWGVSRRRGTRVWAEMARSAA
jgi:anti-sigma regulatory factor (Ser/Thr protein kinase)